MHSATIKENCRAALVPKHVLVLPRVRIFRFNWVLTQGSGLSGSCFPPPHRTLELAGGQLTRCLSFEIGESGFLQEFSFLFKDTVFGGCCLIILIADKCDIELHNVGEN